MALFDLETDPALERDGVPIIFADWEYVRLTLARTTSNERLKREYERVLREFKDRVGPKSDAERESAMLLAFCRVCLLKWETLRSTMRKPPEGIEADADGYLSGIDMRGMLLPYTPERAVDVFETRGFEAFREQVMAQARNAAHFRFRQRQADTGN